MALGGRDLPATEGTAYGRTELQGDDVEIVIPVDTESTSWVVRAEPSNNDPVYLGWDEELETSNGMILQAGENISIDMDNSAQELRAVSDTVGDAVRYLAVE